MSVINLNSVEPGVFYPETYYNEGETDYTNAFQAAVTAANTYVENPDGNNPYRNAVIKLQPGKYYQITKGFVLKYGVSIDGQGATLAPLYLDNSIPGIVATFQNYPLYSVNTDYLRYVFVVNMSLNPASTVPIVKAIEMEYPWVKDSYIKNLQVRVTFNCSEANKSKLGFVLLAAPMTISEIASYDICPVVDTPPTISSDGSGGTKVCYLDGIKIDHIRSNYSFLTELACPYVIRKRCNGDGMVINQLINECGDFSKSVDSLNKKNYGLCIDTTVGLTVSNCIHADGLIRFCSDVTYQSNHNEKGSLTIHYSNISIYNCLFHKPLNEPAIIISEYNWSGTARQCFHTVLLEGVVFRLHNSLPYYRDYEEVRFCGNNATRLYYKNVQVTTFGPVPTRNMDAVVRPSTGFRFSYYYSNNHYETYDCAFREGWIEINNRTPRYMTNQTIVSHIDPSTYSIGYAIIEEAGSFSTFPEQETYTYEMWMINDEYGGIPIGVKMNLSLSASYSGQSESISSHDNAINVTAGQFVRFSLISNNDIAQSANAIDGCRFIIKRTGVHFGEIKYVRIPVSHNGHFADTGEWINGRKWEDTNLAPSSFKTMQNGDSIIIYAMGNYMIRNSVLTSGITQDRPQNVTAGAMYFDTTLNKPIWVKSVANGNPVWVDADGDIA